MIDPQYFWYGTFLFFTSMWSLHAIPIEKFLLQGISSSSQVSGETTKKHRDLLLVSISLQCSKKDSLLQEVQETLNVIAKINIIQLWLPWILVLQVLFLLSFRFILIVHKMADRSSPGVHVATKLMPLLAHPQQPGWLTLFLAWFIQQLW